MPESFKVSAENLKKRLDDMVLGEVFYQEALRQKLDQKPEVQQSIRQLLTQKLLEQVEGKAWSREVTEAEVKAYYDQHAGEYNRPEQVRIADIYIAIPAQASGMEKDALKKKAEAALTEAQASEKRQGWEH